VTSRRILHLGLGNFHRAHQAVYTADVVAADDRWEITGVANTSRTVVEALHRQEMRYSVVTLGPWQTDIRQVGVITDAFVAADEPERLVGEIARPDTHVVSLTVTEKGYDLRPGSRQLDLDAPKVRHDLHGHPPRSTIGRLAAGLLRRANTGGAAVTLLSCDNVTANGSTLAALLREFAAAMPSRDGADLLAFLDGAVACPDTMVDRIVPATTDAHRRHVAAEGFPDAIPVPAEPFSMWVLRDDFAAGRPAWQHAGAVLSDCVQDYETVKVRLLNGSHSLLAYLGLLTGRSLIAEAVTDPLIAEAAWQLGEEYLPTLHIPDELDIGAYRKGLFERFRNHRLGHRTTQVGSDGSLKLAQRVPEAALWHLDRGHTPSALALLVAAWIQCLARPHRLHIDRTGAPQDPNAELLRDLGTRQPGSALLARDCLQDKAILGQRLGESEQFVTAVGELLAMLDDGVPAAVHAISTAEAHPHINFERSPTC
jgi:fructuronate reductase